jgi:hypothetical protein
MTVCESQSLVGALSIPKEGTEYIRPGSNIGWRRT